MSNSHESPEIPTSEENSSFVDAAGAQPVSNNPAAPQPQQSPAADEAANSAPPNPLGGLIDPNLASREDGT